MRPLFPLLLFALCLCSSTVVAQHINAYVVAGGAVSQIEGDELKGFNHWGLHGGVGALVELGDLFSATVETDYTCRGIYNLKYSSSNYYNINLDLHYVDIPVTFFFRDPYGGLRLGAGLSYSRLVTQPHGTIGYRPSYFIPDTTDMRFLSNDVAFAAEARFDIWSGLQFSARYQYSLFPVKRDWHFFSGNESWANNCYNQSLTFRLLWQFGSENHSRGYSHSRSKASHLSKPRRHTTPHGHKRNPYKTKTRRRR